MENQWITTCVAPAKKKEANLDMEYLQTTILEMLVYLLQVAIKYANQQTWRVAKAMRGIQAMRLAKGLWSVELEWIQPATTDMNDDKRLYPMEDPEKDGLSHFGIITE